MCVYMYVHVSLLQECSMAVGVGGGVLWACVCMCAGVWSIMGMSVCMYIVCIHVSLLQRMLQGYIMFVCVCGGGGGGYYGRVCVDGGVLWSCVFACMYMYLC